MNNKWLYDITNFESALNCLSKFVGRDKTELFEFLLLNTNRDVDYRDLQFRMIEEFNIDLEMLNIDDIDIKSIHITTTNDRGKFILENGLFNLKEVIKRNTPLRRFLLERKIDIDVDNKVINYNGNEINLEDDSGRYSSDRNLVYHKLYRDYLINAFHCDEEPLKYDGQVAYRPEFIRSLGILLNYSRLEHEWMEQFTQCCIVEYKASLYNYEWFNYSIDSLSREEYEFNKSYHIKNWLIRQSVIVIASQILGWGKPQIFSYLKFDENISSLNIISIIDSTEERDKLI